MVRFITSFLLLLYHVWLKCQSW